MSARARVVVLMATYNGGAWIDAQVRSILDQRGVDTHIVVSDDASRDDTLERLHAFGDRITVLPNTRLGGAKANFARLIREADVSGAHAIGFADQDDVWMLDRLERQVSQLHGADAVSSNVTAVFDDRRVLLQKAQPQRRFDFVCESAGPGSTFVLRPEVFAHVRDVVVDHRATSLEVPHDWLVYAIVRASGMRWMIDPRSTVDYRQHSDNVRGANVGMTQARIRLQEMRSGEHRGEAARVAALSSQLASGESQVMLQSITRLLAERSRRADAQLLPVVRDLRRARRDRMALRAALALGLW